MPARTFTLSDVDRAFEDAFLHPSPTTALQRAMKPQPTMSNATRLAAAYVKNAYSTPENVDDFADTLTEVIQSVEGPTVASYSHNLDGIQYGSAFAFMMADELEAVHRAHLSEPIVKTIKPTNRYLISCLLSAVSLRHMFATCSTQLRAITDILELESNPYIPRAVHMVVGLGACIHLLVAGRSLRSRGWVMATYSEKQAIIAALKALQTRETLHIPSIQKVLKVCNATYAEESASYTDHYVISSVLD